jgi:murein DD-endopeptidase MepM/ murein hydrolase activator NlpD
LQGGQGKAFLYSLYALIDVIPKGERSTISRAAYVDDVTIPDGTPVIAGTTFRKTWKVRNTGGTTWESGYKLAYFKDNKMEGPDQVNVAPLSPNQTGDLSVDLVAPTTPGVQFSYWMLRDPNGASFGPELYAKINVVQVRPGGGTSALRFPSPVEGNYYINWRFWVPINYGDGNHKGVDYVSNVGSGLPIYASATGTVVMARQCQSCTAGQPSFRLNNLDIPTATAQGLFSKLNPWNYGFGHIVVIRYEYNALPALAKQAFDDAGRTGWYAYVIYGHLQEFFVTKGQQVTAGMQIARLGDSGNSTSPHLHLEVVPKKEATHELPRGTRGQKSTWLDPELMFDT